MSQSEIFLLAMLIIFSVPYLLWRLGRTEHYAPLVVVQIVTGILLGPGVLGAWQPDYYRTIFTADTVRLLNGVAYWAVMLFVWLAGLELNLKSAWQDRRESGIAATLALCVPLLSGCVVALGMLHYSGWQGPGARPWQFVLGIGMACAVTALPILVLLMEKLSILRQPLGQRILRYASLDDVAIWAVLAVILMDWQRVGRQLTFVVLLAVSAICARVIGWLLQAKALIMIVFVNILLDKDLITSDTFTALLLMAISSTMLTIPVVSRSLRAAGQALNRFGLRRIPTDRAATGVAQPDRAASCTTGRLPATA